MTGPRMSDHRSPSYYWFSQVAVLVATTLWAFCDPYFEATIQALPARNAESAAHCGTLRLAVVYLIITFAVLTKLRLFWGFVGTPARFRSLKALLCITTLIGLWCALAIQLPAVAWRGKQVRLAARLAEFELIAKSLRSHWPTDDGERPELGPFMAYPFGVPSTLVLLTPPTLSTSGTSICTVERLPTGAVLFRLSGIEEGDWIEWHPEHQQPRSFTGGLGDSYVLYAKLELGQGWYLVRYNSPARYAISKQKKVTDDALE